MKQQKDFCCLSRPNSGIELEKPHFTNTATENPKIARLKPSDFLTASRVILKIHITQSYLRSFCS